MRALLPKCLCLLALLACAPLAHAQIYHCVGAHGEPVFSGQPCGTPATTSSSALAGNGAAFRGACAKSPRALQQAIGRAFASRDVNRLAGLILWRGMDRASSRATMHALAAWLAQPLAGIAPAYANGPPVALDVPAAPATTHSPASATSPPPVPTGYEISTAGPAGSTRDFGVTELGGCWWLTF